MQYTGVVVRSFAPIYMLEGESGVMSAAETETICLVPELFFPSLVIRIEAYLELVVVKDLSLALVQLEGYTQGPSQCIRRFFRWPQSRCAIK